MMQKRLPKSRRAPDSISRRPLTERSLSVIRALVRYRFLSTSGVVKLAGGNEDVTHRHLQSLYHRGIVSRLTIPRLGNRGEFIYFLDNTPALRDLASRLGVEIDWDIVQSNRERYSVESLGKTDGVGRFLFIRHELMISDFRASLEVACRNSDGRTELARFAQGPNLWGSVKVSSRLTLPFRPDALLTLRFPSAPEGQQHANFFYEADRDTTSLQRFKLKLEAYLHYLKQGQQVQAFGISKVRAVLVETITEKRTEQCRAVAAGLAAKEPLVGMLFWFSTARALSAHAENNPFLPHWVCSADGLPRSLLD